MKPVTLVMYIVDLFLPQVRDKGKTVGHTEYFPDGTAKFCFTDSEKVAQYKSGKQMTTHTKQYEMVDRKELGIGGNKKVTGNLIIQSGLNISIC